MKTNKTPPTLIWLIFLAGFVGLLVLLKSSNSHAQEDATFMQVAPQGFGDRDNSWTWSMQWWNGHLYVGTNRAWHCAEVASFHNIFPQTIPYPPDDPDVDCPEDIEDISTQAEIWRWTPETDTWTRVYQSPADLQLPSGKFISRDIGFRGITVFREANGTEALYVTGVSPKFIGYGVELPPPRILRSTDGVNFTPLPQDPGTFLGDITYSSFRNPVSFNGRLYLIGGIAQGSGVLLEAANPAWGNNNFQAVNPTNTLVSNVYPFNGYLYVGVKDALNGYAVLKSDFSGSPPYNFTTVVEDGGYAPEIEKNHEVLSMAMFNGDLYVGCNGLSLGLSGEDNAAELIRIHPDDSWDVIAGVARNTPDGFKVPLSGYSAGFDNLFNAHMWRMEAFNGQLYVGTFDSSTTFKNDPIIGPLVEPIMGFDLYRSPNGTDFFPVTITGFGDKFNFGVRGMEATPYGLFVGTANYYYGLEVWRSLETGPRIYLPAIMSGASQ